MKNIIFLLLLVAFGNIQAQVITDANTLRTLTNQYIIPNGAITAPKLNAILNGIQNVLITGDSALSVQIKKSKDSVQGNLNAASVIIATKQPIIITGTVTQYLRADLTIGSEMTNEKAAMSTLLSILLNNTPLINTVILFKNGMRLANDKYSVMGNIITLVDPRLQLDIFLTDYKF